MNAVERDAQLLQSAYTMFISALKTQSNLTERTSDSLLAFTNIILKNLNQESPGHSALPKSIKTLQSKFLSANNVITEYTVCSSCHALYPPLSMILGTECFSKNGTSKLIDGVLCSRQLYQDLESSKDVKYFKPFLVYRYRSIKTALVDMFSAQGFEEKIHHWKNRNTCRI